MLTIAIICGGPSLERGVSLNSARSVLDHLSGYGIEIRPLYVDQNKQFHVISSNQLYSNTPSDFDFQLETVGVILKDQDLRDFLRQTDLVFPIIHGAFGESGELQELLETWQIPYIGSDSLCCHRMFNKHLASQILQKNGFATLPSLLIEQASANSLSSIIHFFETYQINRAVIKPVGGGSSIGVFSIQSPEEAYEKYLYLINSNICLQAIVEPFCRGIEFTIMVLANQIGQPVALIPTEIETSYDNHQIFDYRKKYLPTHHTLYHTPSRFSQSVIATIREAAQGIFKLFHMRDFARLDGWLMPDNTLYFTDLNPISGLEQNSFLFQQTAAIGLSHRETLEYVIHRTSERYHLPMMPPNPLPNFLCKPQKQSVYIVCGGVNAERQVSLLTGTNVWLKLLSSENFTPSLFLLSPNHTLWELPYRYALHHTVEEVQIHCQAAEDISSKYFDLAREIQVKLGISCTSLHMPSQLSLMDFMSKAKVNNAFVFIGLHGGEGENGTLQALLEEDNIPFNGSNSESSKLCMDKFLTGKAIDELHSPHIMALPKINFSFKVTCAWSIEDFHCFWQTTTQTLKSASLIIKPRKDGCSAGIALLKTAKDLQIYSQYVLQQVATIPAHTFFNQKTPIEMPPSSFDIEFLFEPYIQTDSIHIHHNKLHHTPHEGWLELTVGVLEDQGVYHALHPSITLAEGATLSIEEKFQGGTGVNLTPPPTSLLTLNARKKIKHMVELCAKQLSIKNYARLDIFFNRLSESLIFIEANTLPALTPSTVFFHQALAESPPLTPQKLLERIIMSASGKITASI